MHIGRRYGLGQFLVWTRNETVAMAVLTGVPTVLYEGLGWRFLALPWVPIALVGTAAAFLVGFKNNATYARLWEARQIYGAIVNGSRAWAIQVLDLPRPSAAIPEARLREVQTRLIHRHLAWLTALRFQLRAPRAWEATTLPSNQEFQEAFFTVAEHKGDLGNELRALLSTDEADATLAATNRATKLIALQSRALRELVDGEAIDTHRLLALERQLVDFYEQQGKAERIKNFPYPRQFATINLFFVRLFVMLIPFGLFEEMQKLSDQAVWATIPIGMLVGWVFLAIEKIGESTENPFEGGPNDVPITTLSRTIEIDLRELLGEKDIPKPVEAQNLIAM